MLVSGPVVKAAGAGATASPEGVLGVCACTTCVSAKLTRHNFERLDSLGDFTGRAGHSGWAMAIKITADTLTDRYETPLAGPSGRPVRSGVRLGDRSDPYWHALWAGATVVRGCLLRPLSHYLIAFE